MWVTSGSYVGHIWIALWVSGSSGSTGVTHFQPWYESIIYLFMRLLFFILGYAISILVQDMGHTKGYRPPDVLPMYKHTYT